MMIPQDTQTDGYLFQNRIVSSGVKPASQFLFNPQNPRIHGEKQRAATLGSLLTLGWVQEVIESYRTGYLLDGHDRVYHALQHGDQDVPFKVIDITEEEEKIFLAVYDQLAGKATIDHALMTELIDSIKKPVNTALAELIDEIAKRTKPHEVIGTDDMEGDAYLVYGDAAEIEKTCWEMGWTFNHVGSVKVVPMESSANAEKV